MHTNAPSFASSISSVPSLDLLLSLLMFISPITHVRLVWDAILSILPGLLWILAYDTPSRLS
jgi:hypothetical protein